MDRPSYREPKAKETKNSKVIPTFVAKKYCEIHQNDVHLTFEKGKTYSNIDKRWSATLNQQKII